MSREVRPMDGQPLQTIDGAMAKPRIDPFRIDVPDTTLERIRDRVATARWPDTARTSPDEGEIHGEA